MEEFLILAAIGSGTALAGGLICYFLTRYGKGVVSLVLLAALGILFVWLWLQARPASGWGAHGYTAFAVLFAAPAFGGGLLGTVIGHYRRAKNDPAR